MEGKLTYGPYATVTFIVHLLRFKNTLHLFVSTQTLQYIVLEQKLQYTFSALLVSSVHFFAIKFKTSANKRVFCAQHHQRNAVHSRAEQSSGTVNDEQGYIIYNGYINLHGFHCQCCRIILLVFVLLLADKKIYKDICVFGLCEI